MRFTLILFLTLLVSVIIAVFASQNPVLLSIQFFGWETETSLTLVIVLAVTTGVLLTTIISSFRHFLRGIKHREALKRIEELETKCENLSKENKRFRDEIDKLTQPDEQDRVERGEVDPG